MTKISHLSHVDPSVCQRLRANRINTVEDLWRKVWESYNANEEEADFAQAVCNVARKLQTEPTAIKEVLIEGEWYQAQPMGWRKWIVMAAASLLVTGLLILQVGIGLRTSWQMVAQAAAVQQLNPFKLIDAQDIKFIEKPATTNGFRLLDEVIGRYPLVPIAPDQLIAPEQLSAVSLAPGSLDNRAILSVPLAPATTNASIVQGTHVTLLLSRRESSVQTQRSDVIIADVIVLQLEEKASTLVATLAIDQSRIEEVGGALATSDAYLVLTAQ